MNRKIFFLFPVITMALSLAIACTKVYENKDEDTSDDTDYSAEEAASDYEWNSSEVINITLNGTSATADGAGVSIAGSVVTITASGTYKATGSLTNGQIIVDSNDDNVVRLIFNGVNITCTTSSPVYVKDAGKAVIILADNTSNYLTDGTSYTFDDTGNSEPNAPLFSKSYMSIFGTGSLIVDGNYGDGIVGKDGLVIKSGTVNVTAADDGIRGKDYIVVWDGNITVNSGGDGLKSNNDNDDTVGFITINDGTFNITSGCDAISATTKVHIAYADMTIISGGGSSVSNTSALSKKGIKGTTGLVIDDGNISINSSDDGLHSHGPVTMNNGTVAISTADDAIHSEVSITVNNGDLTISKSYESIEAPAIVINGGNISFVASNDGFNASKGNGGEQDDGCTLAINGGYIVANVSNGDGMDSNGSATMTGGTMIIHGPSSAPEVAMDINGSFNVSGGFIIAAGPNSGNMIEGPSTTSAQYSVLISGQITGGQPGQQGGSTTIFSSSSLVNIQDASGNSLVTFKPARNAYYIVFSASALTTGTTYNLYTGGTSTGTYKDGLYVGGSYSGGTLKKSFTLSGKLTSVTVN